MKLKNMLSRKMTWKNNPRRSRGSMKIKMFIRAELDELNWSEG
jgi:hypothetical protein